MWHSLRVRTECIIYFSWPICKQVLEVEINVMVLNSQQNCSKGPNANASEVINAT